MAHIPIKQYNSNSKEMILIDTHTHTLQKQIDKGILSVQQLCYSKYSSEAPYVYPIINNNLTTNPYYIETANGGYWDVNKSLDNNLLFNYALLKNAKSFKLYFKGKYKCYKALNVAWGGIVLGEWQSGSETFISGIDQTNAYRDIELTSQAYSTTNYNHMQAIINGVARGSGGNQPSNTIIIGFYIEELKIVDIKY